MISAPVEENIPFSASLQNEFRRWQLLWCTKNDVPNTFLHALACCNVDSFPNIYQLLVIACTLPVTSAEAERSMRSTVCLRSTWEILV